MRPGQFHYAKSLSRQRRPRAGGLVRGRGFSSLFRSFSQSDRPAARPVRDLCRSRAALRPHRTCQVLPAQRLQQAVPRDRLRCDQLGLFEAARARGRHGGRFGRRRSFWSNFPSMLPVIIRHPRFFLSIFKTAARDLIGMRRQRRSFRTVRAARRHHRLARRRLGRAALRQAYRRCETALRDKILDFDSRSHSDRI